MSRSRIPPASLQSCPCKTMESGNVHDGTIRLANINSQWPTWTSRLRVSLPVGDRHQDAQWCVQMGTRCTVYPLGAG